MVGVAVVEQQENRHRHLDSDLVRRQGQPKINWLCALEQKTLNLDARDLRLRRVTHGVVG